MDFFSDLLDRNVEKIYPNKNDLIKRLEAGGKLRIYLGIDPSSPRIHLGNAVVLQKLAQFQNLGHKIILLVGDFTGMIGDPTDKKALRVPLTREQVIENSATYKKQAERFLKFSGKNPAELVYNSQWLSKMTFEDVVNLSGHFTVQQLLERDMFQERIKNKKPIGLHEFLYPLMQGYDSVVLDVDMEIGGTDQTFNMLIGRSLQKELNEKEKFVLTTPLLEGSDGRKMSKSFNNSVDIDDKPADMYGKLMGVVDSLVFNYFEMCTDLTLEQLKKLRDESNKISPIDLKKKLAFEVTKLYHGEKEANSAQEIFENVVQKKLVPEKIEEVVFEKNILPKTYLYFLLETGLCKSSSEATRLASQGGITADGNKVENVRQEITSSQDDIVLKAGKRNFIKIKFI